MAVTSRTGAGLGGIGIMTGGMTIGGAAVAGLVGADGEVGSSAMMDVWSVSGVVDLVNLPFGPRTAGINGGREKK
jgi:hypothetical protein